MLQRMQLKKRSENLSNSSITSWTNPSVNKINMLYCLYQSGLQRLLYVKIIGIVPRLEIVILIIPFLCKSLFENHEILIHYYRFFIVITNSETAAERTGLYRRLYPFEMAMMSQFNNNRIKLFIIYCFM